MILHHPEEKASKSSALPLALISEEVGKLDYQEDMAPLLEPFDEQTTYILYPHKESLKVSQLTQPPKTIIAVDCTWFQTNTVLRHLEIAQEKSGKKFRYLKLEDYETQFWRYQNHGEKALSTAEAIYYFFKELAEKFEGPYKGKYDELLYLYVLNYNIIEEYHKPLGEEKTKKKS